MKKVLFIIGIFVLLNLNIVYAANDSTAVVVNNTAIDKGGKMFNGKFLIPARSAFEAMGADIIWNNNTKVLTATKNNSTVSIKLGSSKITVDGLEKSMEHITVIYDGNLLMPAKSIDGLFNYTSAFDEVNNIMFFSPKNYTCICSIMPSVGVPKVIKNISSVYTTYPEIVKNAPAAITFRNITGLIADYPANPFPQASKIYNVSCNKSSHLIKDLDGDNIPELIISYSDNNGIADDYIVYTCKNGNIYYCGNIRNVLDCGPSDELKFYDGYSGVFVYDYRIGGYMQVVLNNTTLSRGTSYVPSNK